MAFVPRHVLIAAAVLMVVLLISPLTAMGAAAAAVDSVPQTTETVHGDKDEDPVVTCKEGDNDENDSNHNDDGSNHKSTQQRQDDVVLAPSVIEILVKERYLQKFHEALVKTNLVDMISGNHDGPFTVLVPLDIAIKDFRWTRVFSKNADDDEWILHLRDLLLFHIHVGGIPLVVAENDKTNHNNDNDNEDNTHAYKEGTTIVMANGQELQIQRQTTTTTTTTTSQRRIQFTTQTQAVTQIAYQEAINGYVYMIHTVLMPPSFLHTLDTPSYAADETTSFFYSLLEMADLTYLLQVEHDNDNDVFTVLAPTNAAFAKVNHLYIDFLQSPEGANKLVEILLYHIVPNHVYASVHLLPMTSFQQQQQQDDNTTTVQPPKKLETMLSGRDITAVAVFNDEDGSSTIHLHGDNVAEVVEADKLARNGILHRISNVLLPPYRPEATDDQIPIHLRRPRSPAAPSPTPVPASAATPSRVWSLESPTMIDIVNVPIVRYQRDDGGLKLKVILP